MPSAHRAHPGERMSRAPASSECRADGSRRSARPACRASHAVCSCSDPLVKREQRRADSRQRTRRCWPKPVSARFKSCVVSVLRSIVEHERTYREGGLHDVAFFTFACLSRGREPAVVMARIKVRTGRNERRFQCVQFHQSSFVSDHLNTATLANIDLT